MLNKEFKKELIESGKYKEYKKSRMNLIRQGCYWPIQEAEKFDEISTNIFGLWTEEISECERIRNNEQRQKKKIFDHLIFMLEGNWTCYFVTFTFSDRYLESTKAETRRQKISRLLSSFCTDYIFNIDFGKENEREHYHGIICVQKNRALVTKDNKGHVLIDKIDDGYNYGFYSAEEIRLNDIDAKRLTQYITKLTMHSIKVKQTYVSCKKNSPYQQLQKELKRYKDSNRQIQRHFWSDYEEKKTWLLSGYGD